MVGDGEPAVAAAAGGADELALELGVLATLARRGRAQTAARSAPASARGGRPTADIGPVLHRDPPSRGRRARRRPYGQPVMWKRAVFALFAVAAGTNVPTPLLLVYQERLGLSPEVLTALFGCYAAGLVPALLLAGQLSDRLGRRRVAIPGIVLSGLASLAFAAAGDSLGLLFAARFLQGVVSGVVFSVGSAWVGELSLASGEGAGGRRAAFAMTAGFSLGPLTSGLLGEFGPAPTVLPYLVHTALVAVGLVLALPLPETVDLTPPTSATGGEPPDPRPADPRRRRPAGRHGAGPRRGLRLRLPLVGHLGGAAAGRPALRRGRGHRPARRGHPRRRHARRAPAAPARPVDRRRRAPPLGAAGFAAATAFATTGRLPWLIVTAPLLGSGRRPLPRRRPRRSPPGSRRPPGAAR